MRLVFAGRLKTDTLTNHQRSACVSSLPALFVLGGKKDPTIARTAAISIPAPLLHQSRPCALPPLAFPFASSPRGAPAKMFKPQNAQQFPNMNQPYNTRIQPPNASSPTYASPLDQIKQYTSKFEDFLENNMSWVKP
jgi:hypothetical protein